MTLIICGAASAAAAPSLGDLRHALTIIAALLNAGHLEISIAV
jgi:hypothetical protein